MPPKRNDDGGNEEMTGREKKKLKVSAARTIAVQSTRRVSTSSTAGTSNQGQTALPSTIDLEKFVEARAFEIDAMRSAMKTASASSTHRVWQTLPRHLRRRAASHDVRRVPLRLRERASAEMDPAGKKLHSRAIPKNGKYKHVHRTDSFLKRQREKIWLETHLWHAKRMHMEDLWGFRLAVSPTDKVYRPSHRASMHGSILHDASYYSFVEIRGPEKLIISLLESCCDPQGPGIGSQRYLGGSRALETHIYARNAYPYDLIAPLTVMWRPQMQTSNPADRKGKTKETNESHAMQTAALNIRSVWLRFHPSVFAVVYDILKEAASHGVSAYKRLHGDSKEAALEIVNLQGLLNVFEIMGPKASQVIKGALSPIASEKRPEFLQFWASLTDLQSAGSLPRGMIIGFKVTDPRLKFPPKNAKPTKNHSANRLSMHMTFPSAHLADSEIWDGAIRNYLTKPRFKKKDLDERRSKNEILGTSLHAQHEDDRIPVLLIQRSVENFTSSDGQAIHGWTLIIPAGWSMAFFNSLIFTNTRIAGQFQRQTQSYEAGAAYFPRDYPSTEAYNMYAQCRAIEEKSTWDRKPPAKRVNYDKLGTQNPWKVDWGIVIGMSQEVDPNIPGNDFTTTQRETATESHANDAQSYIRPWLLRGSDLPKILSSMTSVLNHGAALLSEIDRLRIKRGYGALPNTVSPSDILKAALINVKITMLLRGAPQDLALIYTLSDNLCRKWEKIMHNQQSMIILDEEPDEEVELASMVPDATSIIGYITTGHYSLARGHGFAIGAIALTRLLELEQQSRRLHPNQNAPCRAFPMLIGVRNTDGHQCRIASVEVLLEA